MKKSIFLLLTLFLMLFSAKRQADAQELWGMTANGGSGNLGTIFKTDDSGYNFSQVFAFKYDIGRQPLASLIEASNGKFYGVAYSGGANNYGVLFEYDYITNSYKKKVDFGGINEGRYPFGSLVQASNGKLYGMTSQGGVYNYGILFEYDPGTNVITKKLDFDGTNKGGNPTGSLLKAANNMLYGMTPVGGASNYGVLFEYNPFTDNFIKRIDFGEATNGKRPAGSLVQASTTGMLYGTTSSGGTSDLGVLFEYGTFTHEFVVLFNFDGTYYGSYPNGSLTEASDGKLYGMTNLGGVNDYGVLFEYEPIANSLNKKLDFNGAANGSFPSGSLIQASDGKLYGMTGQGGSKGYGVLFDYDPVTDAYTKNLDFEGFAQGSYPCGKLLQASNGKLYGLTTKGGAKDCGVLFEYDLSIKAFVKNFDFEGTCSGRNPQGSLMIASNGKLYGMTGGGGVKGVGVLFEYDPVSNDYTKKLDFDGTARGSYPQGSLMQATNGKLYGMTFQGGVNDYGVLFEYDPGTITITKKIDFNRTDKGGYPNGSLIQASNGKLYGMTMIGGANDKGVLFEYDPVTSVFNIKLDFDGATKGELPYEDLMQASNGKLYGMTAAGGVPYYGVLFEYDAATITYTKKIEFNGTDGGGIPVGSLIQSSNGKLYGMTQRGGIYNDGIIFKYDPATDVYNKLFDFEKTSSGREPRGSLKEASNGKLYGMTSSGGTYNYGVLFEYDPSSNSYNKKLDFTNGNGANPYGTLIQIGLPILTTGTVSNITTNSILTGGTVANDGGNPVTARGVCWSTGSAPTIDLASKTSDGTGTGTFISAVAGLLAGTIYFIRSYATNSAGTAYGNEISFKTYNSNAIVDVDGNYYNVEIIGSQVWMTENLKTTMYNNGTSIPLVTDNTAWGALTTPGYCWYNNDEVTYKNSYGALYNWYAVDITSNGGKNICPAGWDVPTDAEWTILADYLTNNGYGYGGSGDDIAKSMAGKWGWWTSVEAGSPGNDMESNNSSGFSALPGGHRDLGFNSFGGGEYWWSSTESAYTYPYLRFLTYASKILERGYEYKFFGLNVRCLKDIASSDTHFTPVWWPGNGMDHMNLYALTATLDNVALQPGDEIGIFDGDVCVGVGVLTQELTGSNYLECKVSRDDPDTPLKDGYTTGNTITYKVWDSSSGAEVSNVQAVYVSGTGTYTAGATSSFNLSAFTSITQGISLAAGWNIMSFTAQPSDMSLKSIVNPLITAGTLTKIQDEKGNAIEKLPAPINWVDNIGLMKVSEGYKIKVTGNTTLSVTGQPVTLPYTISLDAGWNIMGYPSMTSQAALTAFNPLITAATLLKVQDEAGNAIEKLPAPIGWIDNIHTLSQGNGYKVKTSINTSLPINNTSKGEYLFEEVHINRPNHFNVVYSGNGLDQMNIYIKKPSVGEAEIKSGDEIGVFDGDRCVGAVLIDDPNQEYYMAIASLDDPNTTEQDGFKEGNNFELRLWDNQSGIERKTQKVELDKGYNKLFEKLGTSVLAVDFETKIISFLGDAYPNPSTDRTTFTFQIERESKVRLEIYNMDGDMIKILVDQNMSGGMHRIEWDNRSSSGNRASSGVYFYMLIVNEFLQTRKLVIQ